jgi:hypothetical protein
VLLPLGTRCWTQETRTGGATAHSSATDSFDTGAEVVAGTPDELQHLELTVTNTFDLTSFSLTKRVDGAAARYAGGRDYDVAVTCVLPQDGTMTPLITDQVHTLSAGQSVTLDDLPVGARCWATETDDGGATSSTVTHPSSAQALTLGATGRDAITVTNTFDAADLTVEKKVVNGPAGPYTFTLACTTDQGPVTLSPGDAAFKLRDGGAKHVPVPLGATCTVKETHVERNDVVTYRDSDTRAAGRGDGKVVAGARSQVRVTNTFTGAATEASEHGQGPAVGADDLASTGGPAWWMLPLALLMVGGGTAVVWSTRRRSTR